MVTQIFIIIALISNAVIILKWYLVLHEIRLQYLLLAQHSCDQVEDFLQTQYVIILLVQIMISLSDHTQGTGMQ